MILPWRAIYMGVSKNRGTPKYMVCNGNTLSKWDDLNLGVPTIFGNIHLKPPPIYLHIYLHIQIPFSQVSPKNSLAGAEGLRWIMAWLHPRPRRSRERGPLWSHHSGRWCRPKHSGNITLGPMPKVVGFFFKYFWHFPPLITWGNS